MIRFDHFIKTETRLFFQWQSVYNSAVYFHQNKTLQIHVKWLVIDRQFLTDKRKMRIVHSGDCLHIQIMHYHHFTIAACSFIELLVFVLYDSYGNITFVNVNVNMLCFNLINAFLKHVTLCSKTWLSCVFSPVHYLYYLLSQYQTVPKRTLFEFTWTISCAANL